MPKTGIPIELIEEGDLDDYAFVGDILEVCITLFFQAIYR